MEDRKVTINISTSALLKIVFAALLIMVLYIIRDVVLVLLIAMILASAMDPLVDWLYRKAKFPRGLSVILVYLFFIAFITAVLYFLIPPFISQIGQLSGRLQGFKEELASKASTISGVLNDLGIVRSLSSLGQGFADFAQNFFQTSLGVVNGFIQVIAVLVFSFYLISSENGMKNFIRSLVPYKHQAYAIHLTDQIQKKIGHWLLGQLILSGFIFAFDFIGLSILGVKFALALALFAGLLEIVPYLGPIISAIPGVMIAFVESPALALFALIMYIVVQQAENYILVPKIMGKTVGANPLVILLAVLIGFKLAGIVGMLLAVPVVATAGVFFSSLKDREEKEI